MVYIHPEAEYHLSTTLQKIINAEMVPGIAVNPGTSVETVMEMLRIVKKVLVMSVNPGNAGQMYLPYVGKKITKLLSMKEDMDFEIYWDGACSADKILEYAPGGGKGVCAWHDVFVRQGEALWRDACGYPGAEILKEVQPGGWFREYPGKLQKEFPCKIMKL